MRKSLLDVSRSQSCAGFVGLALASFLCVIPRGSGQALPSGPEITSVRLEATDVLVTVRVPAGFRRVTLESRERLGTSAWEPRVVARVDGTGANVNFRLARSRAIELLRVRAETTDPLPSSFYAGTNEFSEVSSSFNGPLAVGNIPGGVDAQNTPPATAPREVVESDIWGIRGQTLYFFNQLRGLQIIDLTNPDGPALRGTLDLPAVGEDLYMLGDKHVVLLAGPGCSRNETEVIVVADNGGTPNITTRVPIAGYLQESRLVGTALYVATSNYRAMVGSNGTTWEWGTEVTGFDLSDPTAPVKRNTVWFAGYGNVVAATDRLLMVVTQDPFNWWQSTVQIIDITSPDGTLRSYESIRTAGRVPDKFKLNWDGGVLTTISEDWRSTSTRRVTTLIETFRLPDPHSTGPLGVVKLGELEVGRGEQLHATRFDGHYVYVVTFFRIDPLWVIDLTNPATPRVAGSVDVPGWSTYIRPLGDRLVTIGVESNRVAVSLFDVANPAAPVLASRLRLGENYSWSEANSDEQAFTVLADAGLILVPFTGFTPNGSPSKVQLIDLNGKTLVARGAIEQTSSTAPARRTTLYANRILSISGWQLLSVDATDRDHPIIRNTLSLAWPVDRVLVEGDFLIEVASGSTFGWWGSAEQAIVRIARGDSPNQILSELPLGTLPILAATVQSAKLYLIQGQSFSWGGPFPLALVNDVTPPSPTNLVLSIFDVSALPAVRKLGEASTSAGVGLSGDLQALWPKPDLLVVSGGGFSWWWPCLVCAVPAAADAQIMLPWWGGRGDGGHLVAFDVGDASAPSFASEVDLTTNGFWNFSQAFVANGLIHLSHQISAFEDPVPVAVDELAVDIAPARPWITRSYLDVVDFGDSRQPLVRRPVNIPGRLNGTSHDGAVLYTVANRYIAGPLTTWNEYLDASAYDGVSAHLVDSLVLPNSWPHPLLVSSSTIFIGWPDYGTNAPATAKHSLQSWELSMAGKFTRTGRTTLAAPASTLALFGDLLAVQSSEQSLSLFDASNPAALKPVGESRPSGCQWYDLSHGDGNLEGGLWLPLGAYGVAHVSTTP